MAIEYSWKVDKLKTTEIAKGKFAITQVYWSKTGVEDGVEGVFNGATPFPPSEITENFTPFKKVTEKQVLEWIKDKIDEHFSAHVDHMIKLDMDRKRFKQEFNDLPWEK
jgi:hypothetical protein